jgi:hypothetical protein
MSMAQGLLDCPVKPGNDSNIVGRRGLILPDDLATVIHDFRREAA